MAISTSKKSLGKILAISLASAMAMSSLSAALVSVSAVQDPALASNGQIKIVNDGEEKIIAALRTGDVANFAQVGDNLEVDTIVGNHFDLTADGAFTNNFFKSILEYEDSDGLTLQDVDPNSFNITDVDFSISSGSSYAEVNKTFGKNTANKKTGRPVLIAKRSGTATLKIKVSADVEPGGGKSKKNFTFNYYVTINVRDQGEVDLAAYRGAPAETSQDLSNERLTDQDLADVAAWNDTSLVFKFLSFSSTGNGDVRDSYYNTNATAIGDNDASIDNDNFAAELKSSTINSNNTTDNTGVATLTDQDLYDEIEAELETHYASIITNATERKAAIDKLMVDFKKAAKASASGANKGVVGGEIASDLFTSPVRKVQKQEINGTAILNQVKKNLPEEFAGAKSTEYTNVFTAAILSGAVGSEINSTNQGLAAPAGINTALDSNKLETQANPTAYALGDAVNKITDGTLGTDYYTTNDGTNNFYYNTTGTVSDKVYVGNATTQTDEDVFVQDDTKDVELVKTAATPTFEEVVASGANQNVWKDAIELEVNTTEIGSESEPANLGTKVVKDDQGTAYYIGGTIASELTDGPTVTNGGNTVQYFKVKKDASGNQIKKNLYNDGSDYKTLGANDIVSVKKLKLNPAIGSPDATKIFNKTPGKVDTYLFDKTGTNAKADALARVQAEVKKAYKELSSNNGEEYLYETLTVANAQAEAKKIIQAAYDSATRTGTPAPEGSKKLGTIKSVRFYAGNGVELLTLGSASPESDGHKWERGSSGVNNTKGYTIATNGDTAQLYLDTKGTTGSVAVKAFVEYTEDKKTDDFSLNLKVVKAADFGSQPLTFDKEGGKTVVNDGASLNGFDVATKSLSSYDIRTTGSVTVNNGTLGAINAGEVVVEKGRTGDIIEPNGVSISDGATVGNIVDASGDISLSEGAIAGKITGDGASGLRISNATVDGIDVDCSVEIEGGQIKGDVISSGGIDGIKISSGEDDDNVNMEVMIAGDVISKNRGSSKIVIDNESDEGSADIVIEGDVIAKYANIDNDTESVKIGSANTSGIIKIGGVTKGQYMVLGGNGLVRLGSIAASDEIDRDEDDGVVTESTLKFESFNTGIGTVSGFDTVKVAEGSVTVQNPMTTTTLDIQNDTQIVLSALTVEDIDGDGSIVVPAGKLVVNGNIDSNPALALLGDVSVDTLAYSGSSGLRDKFALGGLKLTTERQANGVYNYIVTGQELTALTPIGKNVNLGKGQTKTVQVIADAALPEGANIVWESGDKDIITVDGSGTTATLTGVDIGSVDVTAKIVDANGRDLGYEDATFNTEVLYADTVDISGSTDPGDDPDSGVALDTKKKNMTAGDTYTFMVRGNNDVDNLSVTSGDTNVATVALANGADARGALYNITAVADGKTDITVTYQGKTSKIAVKVGGFQLDTTSKKMAPGQVYSVLAKNVPADQAGNITLAYDSNIVDVVKVNDNYNGRGVLFNVTAKAIGDTEVKATYNNETESMAVNVVENTGKLTLDTASYTMPFGGTYTIGVKVEKNGRGLSGEEVRAMITSGELVVSDSRTGSIVTTEVQANGNVRVTGRQREGTTYVQFIVMQNGQRVTHASVGVTVQNGATAGGSSVRSISQW